MSGLRRWPRVVPLSAGTNLIEKQPAGCPNYWQFAFEPTRPLVVQTIRAFWLLSLIRTLSHSLMLEFFGQPWLPNGFANKNSQSSRCEA